LLNPNPLINGLFTKSSLKTIALALTNSFIIKSLNTHFLLKGKNYSSFKEANISIYKRSSSKKAFKFSSAILDKYFKIKTNI